MSQLFVWRENFATRASAALPKTGLNDRTGSDHRIGPSDWIGSDHQNNKKNKQILASSPVILHRLAPLAWLLSFLIQNDGQ